VSRRSPLARLFSYSRRYRGRLLWALVAMIVYAIGSAGIAALIKPILDNVLPYRDQLGLVAWSIIGLNLLKGAGSYASSYLMTDVGQRVVMDIRNQLYRHILGQSAAFFAQRTTGQLLSRINNDVGQVQQAVSETFGDLARESIAMVGFATLLFFYDAWLAVFCLVSAPLVVYPLVRLGQRVRRTTHRSQEALEQLSHISTEGLTGHRIVKAFGNEGKEAERFSRAGYQLFRTNMKVTAALSSLPPLMELLGGFGMAGALWYGSREISSGSLTIGELTSFIATLFLMYGPAKKLSRVNANLQQARAAAERIFAMLDTHTEVTDKAGALSLEPLRESIEFRDVMFGYDETHGRILRGVSFTVRAGQMVAVVGRSGAGKTTLVNLLPRFYDVTDGSIRIDGTDIREVTLSSLRSRIGMVTQETVLFDDSVANNIAYGAPSASREEIVAAARAAHAHEFIVTLEHGYETFVGERGQRLSGGQRQRLAIARALLRNAPILVLDEATSALDSESELLVQEALSTLMMNRTSFVIAHRLSTIRRADQIIVLERGKIVESGRHDELLKRPNGVYAGLYDMQLLEERKPERRLPVSQLANRPS
jgi:subfamily B ATP-binding cassette protein MsbA